MLPYVKYIAIYVILTPTLLTLLADTVHSASYLLKCNVILAWWRVYSLFRARNFWNDPFRITRNKNSIFLSPLFFLYYFFFPLPVTCSIYDNGLCKCVNVWLTSLCFHICIEREGLREMGGKSGILLELLSNSFRVFFSIIFVFILLIVHTQLKTRIF